MIPNAGDIITVQPYPFVRDTYRAFDDDAEGGGECQRPTWKPGIRHDGHARYCGHGEYEETVDTVADAEGALVLTVVSVHRLPGRYPARVFYTRKWVTPDGHEFGKPQLRIATVGQFTRLASGYRHPYAVVAAPATQEATA